jgi:hypothetical protein
MTTEHWQNARKNGNDQEKKKLPQCHFVHKKSYAISEEINVSLCRRHQVMKDWSYDMTHYEVPFAFTYSEY